MIWLTSACLQARRPMPATTVDASGHKTTRSFLAKLSLCVGVLAFVTIDFHRLITFLRTCVSIPRFSGKLAEQTDRPQSTCTGSRDALHCIEFCVCKGRVGVLWGLARPRRSCAGPMREHLGSQPWTSSMRHTASGLQMCKNARRYVARCLVTSFFKAGFQSYNTLCCAHKRSNILVTAEF